MSNNAIQQDSPEQRSERNRTVIDSWLSGSLSSVSTTVIYQPLELLKTRMQLNENAQNQEKRILGRATQSAAKLAHDHGIRYLWRGTGAVSIHHKDLLDLNLC